VGGQYLLVQPGANPVLYVTRSDSDNKPDGGDEGGSGGGLLGFINNYIPNLPSLPSIPNFPSIPGIGIFTETNTTDEKPTEKPAGEKEEKVNMYDLRFSRQ
jgi:hypothetical protein